MIMIRDGCDFLCCGRGFKTQTVPFIPLTLHIVDRDKDQDGSAICVLKNNMNISRWWNMKSADASLSGVAR